MHLVNRHLVVLTPKQPYIDWANGLGDGDGPTFDPATDDEGGTAFLVPEATTVDEIHAFVIRHSEEMFEHELDAWQQDPATWPRNRSYTVLQEWFEVRVHSLVVDLDDGLLLREPM